jgi:Fe-S cluster biogenesis protein NfuA
VRSPPDAQHGPQASVGEGDVSLRLGAVARILRAHGGGIEQVEPLRQGRLRVRLTGACSGCQIKALTVATVVEPVLTGAESVREVEVLGGRVSAAAARRLQLVGTAFPGAKRGALGS